MYDTMVKYNNIECCLQWRRFVVKSVWGGGRGGGERAMERNVKLPQAAGRCWESGGAASPPTESGEDLREPVTFLTKRERGKGVERRTMADRPDHKCFCTLFRKTSGWDISYDAPV